MKIIEVLYLNSGRIFILQTNDGYVIEATEMRDVSVGGKENLEVRTTTDPHIIWNHLVPAKDKWLMTVSTQKGCVHNCRFCDVATLPFRGNLSQAEIEEQVKLILDNTPYIRECNKAKIGFARMGEPAYNLQNVINTIKALPDISYGRDFKWLPCFNSILPRHIGNGSGYDVIDEVISVKENVYDGFLHFQISCNSTNETQRQYLFSGADVLSIEDIVSYINNKHVTNRTVTLNFIVMEGIEVDVSKLKKMGLNGDKFCVKLIPLNNTNNAESNGLDTLANYSNYEKLVDIGNEFNAIGVNTVVDAIAKCEEAGLCCGQLAQQFIN